MKRVPWSVAARLVGYALLLIWCFPAPGHAQGVTTAAVAGRVTDDAGAAVAGVEVLLTKTSTGERFAAHTGDDGRYNLENVAIGGPYTVSFRGLGFEPKTLTEVYLRLGQRLELNESLKRTAVEVAGVTVQAEQNPLVANRTGAAGFVSDSQLHRFPTLARNFTEFVQTIPQVIGQTPTGGVASVGGANFRFNNIQIDGGVNNDLFGLSANGAPGGQANAHPISIEAVKEYQVLIAPFDIRQGSFTGGLINAVTYSGTNAIHGSAFYWYQDKSIVGHDTLGNEIADFTQQQYGFSVGGPIVRDRLHFFVSGDFQTRGLPSTSLAPPTSITIGDDTTGGADSVGVGIRRATADTVQKILQNKYGFDPGNYKAVSLNNPDANVFVKLTGTLATNSRLEVSYNYVNANSDNLTRNPTQTGFRDGYQLSQSGYNIASTTNTVRAIWTAQFGAKYSNELITGYQRVRDNRVLPNDVPLIFVNGDRSGTFLAAGSERFSQANSLDQDIYEVTDNLTFPVGTNHLLTAGTHNEFFSFTNVFFPASIGVWSFASPAALEAGQAYRYEIAVPGNPTLRPNGPTASWSVQQFGGYVQDRWSPVRGLAVTGGVRYDLPNMSTAIPTNAKLDSAAPVGLNINTASFPKSNGLFSWRLGAHYDLTEDGATVVRGGIGTFTGRPPYVWLSNAYSNTGLEQATLVCDGAFSSSGGTTDTVPAFTVDPKAQPTHCGSGNGVGATPPIPSIVYFDPSFKFPQVFKVAAGLDRQVGRGLLATMDFVYSKTLNQMYLNDVNLKGVQSYMAGEGGRAMYGTITATGGANPVRISPNFRDVIEHTNKSDDQSVSFAVQLTKHFANGLEFAVAYAYSHAQDLISLGSSIAASNLRFTPLDGTLADRNLRTSAFDQPHKITISGTTNGPWNSRFSLIYVGVSGTPYAYVVSNDANADGISSNDLVYVPRNAGDITLAPGQSFKQLDSYINSESCLASARGRIMERGSCRNPWMNFLNARLAFSIPSVRGQSVEVIGDMFNVLSFVGGILNQSYLFHNTWGQIKQTSSFENANLLQAVGYDATYQRPIYKLNFSPTNLEKLQVDPSRWRLQLGVRYAF
ncbi:MAG TPA: TonB-dependent receptor [Gemmatimonadales bacterium]|nr:TonB-dependent receptor [Gemmatimonadales bacterium]